MIGLRVKGPWSGLLRGPFEAPLAVPERFRPARYKRGLSAIVLLMALS